MREQGIENDRSVDGALAPDTEKAARAALAETEGLLAAINSTPTEMETAVAGVADLSTAAQAKLSEIGDVATAAVAARTQLNDAQAVVAAKSSHIQGAQEHADKVRAELDRLQTAAAQQATETEGMRARAQSASDSITEFLTAVRGYKTAAEGDLSATTAARDQAKVAAATTKALSDKADSIEERISSYEARLAELDEQSKAQLDSITALLPGATSAGLAYAFDDRRKTFLKPATRWQILFVGSLFSLALLALTGLWTVYTSGAQLGWDELARLWAARLPIAGALIWLALHASRESALAKRLEEDYGYKGAIAASFQGFQRLMADIGSAAPEGSPLSKLCSDTLSTLASPPGRIYDKHQLIVTPSTELASAATQFSATATAAK